MNIDKMAIVGKKAVIAEGVEVGPFAIIEDGVELRRGVKIWPHAYICGGTIIDEETQVHMGAVVGHLPQDLAFKNKPSYVRIGKRAIIREYATIHRGTKEGSATVIGDDCYLMAISHVGHNCEIGNSVIIANGALLAGYVMVGDSAFISGNVVIHQFCRIGKLAMVGGFTGINQDVPPYMLARGPSIVESVNLVGLKRVKCAKEVLDSIKEAYKILYKSDLNTTQAIEAIGKLNPSQELDYLIEFIKSSKRGICKKRNQRDDFFER